MSKKVYFLSEADRRLLQDTLRRVRAGSGSQKPERRRRIRPGGGGGNRSSGTANSLALCVADIPKMSVPDLAGKSVSDWEITPGQEGPDSARVGTNGDPITQYTGKKGVVLLDWKKTYDHADLSSYADAKYDSPKVKLAPIVESFTDQQPYGGGGLGGSGVLGQGIGGTIGNGTPGGGI